MRYVVLALLGMLGVLLAGSIAAGVSIAGVSVDILLLMVTCVALLDKTSAPVLFAAGAGLCMDILYSTSLGVYALPYAATAALVMFLSRNIKRFNILVVFASGAGGYLLKELLMIAIVYVLGARFSVTRMVVREILPAAAVAGGLNLLAYMVFSRLYQLSWMRPRAKHAGDDLI